MCQVERFLLCCFLFFTWFTFFQPGWLEKTRRVWGWLFFSTCQDKKTLTGFVGLRSSGVIVVVDW